MKAKYYPHITAAGALLLTIAPLCFVLSLHGSQSDAELTLLDAELTDSPLDAELTDSPLDARGGDSGSQLAQRNAFDALERSTPVAPFESSVPTLVSSAAPSSAPPATLAAPMLPSAPVATRVAMLPGRPVEPPPRSSAMSDASAMMDRALLSDPEQSLLTESAAATDNVPFPSESKPTRAPAVAGTSPSESQHPAANRAAADSSETDRVGADGRVTRSTHVSIADSPIVKTLVDAGSHFGATAHLAMRQGFQDYGRDAKTAQPPVAPRTDANMAEQEQTRHPATEELSSLMRGDVGMVIDDDFGQPVEAALEDVILQQPLESRPVSRVENIVAVTQAKGWPVALVRSDLPDDQWWVQQMVGIRGSAFAARANFGNENSIRGSVYHLVFVFLDSPDEVRRFRIAKQFRELPEGIRRSREFTFTRR